MLFAVLYMLEKGFDGFGLQPHYSVLAKDFDPKLFQTRSYTFYVMLTLKRRDVHNLFFIAGNLHRMLHVKPGNKILSFNDEGL